VGGGGSASAMGDRRVVSEAGGAEQEEGTMEAGDARKGKERVARCPSRNRRTQYQMC
jgi:hypothetical protein